MSSSFKRTITLADILDYLEKYENSEGSEEEENANNNTTKKIDISNLYISPPEDGCETEEDFGEEDNVEIDNLPRSHLFSDAILAETEPNLQNTNEPNEEHAKRKKVIKIRQWDKKDIQELPDTIMYPYKPTSAQKLRTPCEIFELFIDVEVIDLLTKETVRFAINKGDHSFRLSIHEMKAFLGILIVSGYCTVPRRRLYWDLESDTHNELIASSMRQDRFEEIMKYLHTADNNNLDPTDKYSKIRPLLNMINDRFLRFGAALGTKDISIDESMIPYYGRHPTKQFIRGKPIQWGYKGWVSASPHGYAYFIELYQRCKVSNASPGEYQKVFGLGGEVVLKMLDKLQNYYHGYKFSLYFDNYFTSIKLLEEITVRGHGATGTIHSNRVEKCPLTPMKTFEKKDRGSFEYFSDHDSKVLIARWNDNGVVTIASNQHSVLPIGTAKRFSLSQKKKIGIPMPKLIKSYNSHMGGVDRLNQNVSAYRIGIRGKKWYFPLISYLLNVCINNAWLFAREGGYSNDLLAFTRTVAQDILKSHGIAAKNPRGSKIMLEAITLSSETRTDNIGHSIIKAHPQKRRRCKQCNSQTFFSCVKCKVGLHLKCSMAYHQK